MARVISILSVIALSAGVYLLWNTQARVRALETSLSLCEAKSARSALTHPAPHPPPALPAGREAIEESTPPPSITPAEVRSAQPPNPTPEGESVKTTFDTRAFIAETRLHSVSQLMQLTESEREALKRAFQTAERGKRTADVIEEVLGFEQAEQFRKQVRDVFSRVKTREEDREVYYYARTLSLTSEQEVAFRSALSDVERSVAEWGRIQGVTLSPQEQLQCIRAERDLRASLMRERLQGVLSESQYQTFLLEQAESPAFELELFHEVPDEEPAQGPESAPVP